MDRKQGMGPDNSRRKQLMKIHASIMDTSSLNKIVFPIGRVTPNGVSLLGTGFIANKMGMIVTSAHVVNNDDNNLVLVLKESFASGSNGLNVYQDTADSLVQYVNAKIIRIDPIHDLCILKIDNDVASNIRISSSDNIQVADEVCIVGYPHCDRGRMVLTYQESTVGAKILIESAAIKTKHIVLNMQTRPGQSGSPVFNKVDSSLVAIIIGSYAPTGAGGISIGGIDPLTLHHTTHAISAESLTKMLQ